MQRVKQINSLFQELSSLRQLHKVQERSAHAVSSSLMGQIGVLKERHLNELEHIKDDRDALQHALDDVQHHTPDRQKVKTHLYV